MAYNGRDSFVLENLCNAAIAAQNWALKVDKDINKTPEQRTRACQAANDAFNAVIRYIS